MRRLPGYGWAIERPDGKLSQIKRDDGLLHAVVARIVGTREASRLVGVRPSNFVRDWAARPDFPAPLADLASGRVWREEEVEAFAARHRAPKPTRLRIADIARRIVWWQPPEKTLARRADFVGRVMASGSLDEIRDVERFFGRHALRDAIPRVSPGVFDRRSWNYWLLVLRFDRSLALPQRRVT